MSLSLSRRGKSSNNRHLRIHRPKNKVKTMRVLKINLMRKTRIMKKSYISPKSSYSMKNSLIMKKQKGQQLLK